MLRERSVGGIVGNGLMAPAETQRGESCRIADYIKQQTGQFVKRGAVWQERLLVPANLVSDTAHSKPADRK
jgi:hypothetical protein